MLHFQHCYSHQSVQLIIRVPSSADNFISTFALSIEKLAQEGTENECNPSTVHVPGLTFLHSFLSNSNHSLVFDTFLFLEGLRLSTILRLLLLQKHPSTV